MKHKLLSIASLRLIHEDSSSQLKSLFLDCFSKIDIETVLRTHVEMNRVSSVQEADMLKDRYPNSSLKLLPVYEFKFKKMTPDAIAAVKADIKNYVVCSSLNDILNSTISCSLSDLKQHFCAAENWTPTYPVHPIARVESSFLDEVQTSYEARIGDLSQELGGELTVLNIFTNVGKNKTIISDWHCDGPDITYLSITFGNENCGTNYLCIPKWKGDSSFASDSKYLHKALDILTTYILNHDTFKPKFEPYILKTEPGALYLLVSDYYHRSNLDPDPRFHFVFMRSD